MAGNTGEIPGILELGGGRRRALGDVHLLRPDVDLCHDRPLKRFLLHVLPSRFIRIRHYGFLANAVRRETLAPVRTRLGQSVAAPESAGPPEPEPWEMLLRRLTGKDVTQCPRCGAGSFLISDVLPAASAGPARSP